MTENVSEPIPVKTSCAGSGASIQATNLFITWPHCDVTTQECGNMLKEVASFKWLVVSQETHSDGSYHLHAVVKLTKRTRVKHAFLDSCAGKHGDYARCRSLVNSMHYIAKQDPEPFCVNIDLKAWLLEHKLKIKHKGNYVMTLLKDGKTLDDIIDDDELSGYALINKRKIEEMAGYLAHKSERPELEWSSVCDDLVRDIIENDCDAISDWLSKNVKVPRLFRQKQLYVWGPKKMGKTTLINSLRKYLKVYQIPAHQHHEDWSNGNYDLAYLDEYIGEKTIQWLNKWLEGSEFKLTSRYTSTVKTQNIPTLILSNFSLDELYCDKAEVELEALKSRLLIVNVDSFIDIFE